MTPETQSIEIAKEILHQIKCFDRAALMAWGATGFLALEESIEYKGGLSFKVNGLTFQGTVMIQLRWVDDYSISFIDRSGKLIKECKEVYCEMLIETIDFIEGK